VLRSTHFDARNSSPTNRYPEQWGILQNKDVINVDAVKWLSAAEEFFSVAQRRVGTPKAAGFLGISLSYLSDFYDLENIPENLKARADKLKAELQKLMPSFSINSAPKTDSFAGANNVYRLDATTEAIAKVVSEAMDRLGSHNPQLLPIVTTSIQSLIAEFPTLDQNGQVEADKLIRTLQNLVLQLPSPGADFGVGDSFQNDTYGAIVPGVTYGGIGYQPEAFANCWNHNDSIALEQEYAIAFQQYCHLQAGN
jgi:hypothetical protein